MAQNEGPGHTRKVIFRCSRRKPRRGKKRGHGTELALPQFQHEDTPGRQEPLRVGRDRPVTVEAVGPAVERTPGVEDVDIEIKPDDLKVDTMRSSGAGGQHVNKTESAIRITHVPSGIVVAVQEERSQHKNRAKAMAMLRAKLYDAERTKRDAARAADRRGQIGSGDRSERIRTYNFPQGRVSDHRINLTLYKLPQVIEGEALGEIIDALVTEHQAELLAAEGTTQ